MAKPKDSAPVTVTVRPDGSYYVEKTQQHTRMMVTRSGPGRNAKPVSATIQSTLKEVAGIAVAVKTVAPSLGPYGVLAALGFGVLRALATPEPAPPQFQLRRVKGRSR